MSKSAPRSRGRAASLLQSERGVGGDQDAVVDPDGLRELGGCDGALQQGARCAPDLRFQAIQGVQCRCCTTALQ